MKWITLTEYVDLATGEVIEKADAEKNYYIVRFKKKHKRHERKPIGFTTFTYECRRKCPQGELFGGTGAKIHHK